MDPNHSNVFQVLMPSHSRTEPVFPLVSHLIVHCISCLCREFSLAGSEQERLVLHLGPGPADASSHCPTACRRGDCAAVSLQRRSVGSGPARPCPHSHTHSQLPHRPPLDTSRPQPAWYAHSPSPCKRVASADHALRANLD